MTTIPAGLAAQQAVAQQNIALSVIKQSAQADQAIADLVADAVESAPTTGSRGSLVNFTV